MPRLGPIIPRPPVNIQAGVDVANSLGGNVSRAVTASTAYFCAFQVGRSKAVTKSRHRVTVQSGNVDAGVYDSAGNRLASAGSTACGVGAAEQDLTFTGGITLLPGVLYYRAFTCDNVTATFFDISGGIGLTTTPPVTFSVASSFPLPISVAVPGSGSATRNFVQVIE